MRNFKLIFMASMVVLAAFVVANAEIKEVNKADALKAFKAQQLKRIKSTFEFGTYGEQVKILREYQTKRYDVKKNPAYKEALTVLMSKDHDANSAVKYSFVTVIGLLELEQYYSYYQRVLNESYGERTPSNDVLAMLALTLNFLSKLSNQTHAPIFKAYYEDVNKHYEHPQIRAASALGIAKLGIADYNKKFIAAYVEASTNEDVGAALLEGIAMYKDIADLDFFADIVVIAAGGRYLRWIAISHLSQYAPSERALAMLVDCYKRNDAEDAARAIYAMRKFSKDKVYSYFIKASKHDSIKIRAQAVLGLESFSDERTIRLLKYKSIYDAEANIRAAAKNILIKKGIIKDETKDTKDKPAAAKK